jgi:uncharacterized MAPEG superfamily protein
MIALILLVLLLFVVQTLLPSSIRYLRSRAGMGQKLGIALGPRDQQPDMPILGGRAARALANLQEALPVFLTLALLHLIRGTATGTPTTGALVFLIYRALYVPAYLSGVPGVRSAVWMTSWVGLGMLLVPLLSNL